MDDEKKIKRLEQLNVLLNEVESGGITPEEVGELFGALVEVMKQIKQEVDTRLANVGPEMERRLGNMSSYVGNFENQVRESSELSKSAKKQIAEEMRKMRSELKGVENLIPEEVDLAPLETKLNTLYKAFTSLTSEKIVEKINTSTKKIKREQVEGLEEALKVRSTSTGGVTNTRIQQAFKYILKTEEPTGDIDGVNTTYTVTQGIFAILSMSLNGETIAQLPNYTINGNTITFSTALPAAYSGKDFEIKYI